MAKNGNNRLKGLGTLVVIIGGLITVVAYVSTVAATSNNNKQEIGHIQQNGKETNQLLHKIDRRQAGVEANQRLIMDKLGIRNPD